MKKLNLCLLALYSGLSLAQSIPDPRPDLGSTKITAGKSQAATSDAFDSGADSAQALEITDDDFPLQASGKAANKIGTDVVSSNSRSARDAALFKNVSPSVVLIITKDGIGSGTLIGQSGEILTNWHVVGNNKEVAVVFKPEKDTQKLSKTDIIRGTVNKVDQVSDLAVVKADFVPPGRKPVRLGTEEDISIGSDVHAIGHPKGESWTYTKGVVSQYRNDYEWSGGKGQPKHIADVIQTQTPINPGNSGGPLVSDNGVLIGVNSFKSSGAEGLNFAVSINDVKRFVTRTDSRYAQAPVENKQKTAPSCKAKEVFKGKSADGLASVVTYDSKCTGKADVEFRLPYDTSKPMLMRVDRNLDGTVDAVLFSQQRNNKWDYSIWDNNYDGRWDLVGYHKNGDVKPYRYEDYNQAMASR